MTLYDVATVIVVVAWLTDAHSRVKFTLNFLAVKIMVLRFESRGSVESPERLSRIDQGLMAYRPASPKMRPKNWTECPEMIPVIPGVAKFEAERLPGAFAMGKAVPEVALQANGHTRGDYVAGTTDLRTQFVTLTGAATTAMEQGNEELMRLLLQHAQYKYAVMQHALRAKYNPQFCAEHGFDLGEVNPVLQMGHPGLHMPSKEWTGSLEDAAREVGIFDRAQIAIINEHNSRDRSSILGHCQIIDQRALATDVPSRIASIALPHMDVQEGIVIFNPTMETSEEMIPNPLNDGWYGKFDGRIYNYVPVVVRISGHIFERGTGQLRQGSITFNAREGVIQIEHEGIEPYEIPLRDNADNSTMRLIMDLLDGITPLDRFEDMPTEFDQEAVPHRGHVRAPGVFHSLEHYYGPGSERSVKSAEGLAAINGRLIVEGAETVLKLLTGGQETRESERIAAIHGRHIVEDAIWESTVQDAPGHIANLCLGRGITNPVPFEFMGLSKTQQAESRTA